jgi:hypothetical protein
MSKHSCPSCGHKFETVTAKRTSKKASGPQTWATVRLEDGRVFLTSAYERATAELTEKAHAEYAQYRGRMEDSGDRSDYGQGNKPDRYGHARATTEQFAARIFLNPNAKPVPVVRVDMITDAVKLENCREFCFQQRGQRQGWLSSNAIAAE